MAARVAEGDSTVADCCGQKRWERGTPPYGQGLVLCLLVFCGSLRAADRMEKTLETTPNPRVTVTNVAGQIVIRGWDKSQVHAVYTPLSPHLEWDTDAMPPSGPADKIRFVTHLLDPKVVVTEQKADCDLDVPLGSSLEIRNAQGSVRIEKLQGDDATVETVGAAVSVSDFTGHLLVQSVGGNIDVIRASGRVEAYSITGNLHFLSPATSKLRGSTTSGRILFEGDFPEGGDYSLSDYNGNIELICPPSASFELFVKTVQGKVINEMPMTVRHREATPLSSANSFFGTHLTGKATVNLKSFSGTIRIRQR